MAHDLPCAVCTSLDDLVSLFAASEQSGGSGQAYFTACGHHPREMVVNRMKELNAHSGTRGYAPEGQLFRIPISTDGQEKKDTGMARLKGMTVNGSEIMDFSIANEEIEVATNALEKASNLLKDVPEEFLRSPALQNPLKAVISVTRKIDSLAEKHVTSEDRSGAKCVHSAEIPWRVNVSDWACDILESEPLDDQLQEIRKHFAGL